MKPLGDTNRHYWLAQRMAKTTGVDVVTAHQDGVLPQKEWAQMVQNCRGCDWSEGCVRWLQRTAAADTVPHSCANCGRFTELKAQADERV